MHTKKKIENYVIFLELMLGEGSYGKVYEGEHQTNGTRVAVKMLSKKTVNKDDYFKKALFEEIKILGCLKSDHIVGLIEVMESPNYYYLIQELCTGGDLRGEMTKRGVIPEAEAIGMLKQICTGFVAMLREGVIHRDLKPDNILVSKSMLKICDFGFSKKLNNNRLKNKTMVGTPLYMSLQILKDQPYTGKCDIWALGFIFYQLLHGITPWTANSQFQLCQNIQNKPLKISQKLGPNTKSCIEAMLGLQEKDRISWDELLRHPIFEGHFNYYITLYNNFEDKLKVVMNQLRYLIKSSNIDLERLFSSRGYSKDSELTLQDFRKFLTVTGCKITPEESRFVFQKIDTDDSDSISLGQLQSVLAIHQIPMKSVNQPGIVKRASLDSNGQQNQQSFSLENRDKIHAKLVKTFKKLDQKMTKNNLLLQQVYGAYDIDNSGDMTIKEFSRIIKKLDDTFSENEIIEAFRLIDTSHDGSISFDEFNRYFCKCVGVAYGAQGNKW